MYGPFLHMKCRYIRCNDRSVRETHSSCVKSSIFLSFSPSSCSPSLLPAPFVLSTHYPSHNHHCHALSYPSLFAPPTLQDALHNYDREILQDLWKVCSNIQEDGTLHCSTTPTPKPPSPPPNGGNMALQQQCEQPPPPTSPPAGADMSRGG